MNTNILATCQVCKEQIHLGCDLVPICKWCFEKQNPPRTVAVPVEDLKMLTKFASEVYEFSEGHGKTLQIRMSIKNVIDRTRKLLEGK